MPVPNLRPIGEAGANRLQEGHRTEVDRIQYLRIALVVVGVAFIVGIATCIKLWPSGWSWHTGQALPHYLQMILGVYATLGVFLLMASRSPT